MLYYKLARPDGFDFHTGKTINYRGDGVFPHTVKAPRANALKGVCSDGVLHACDKPNDCFVGAKIPCSAYIVSGNPVCGNREKWGFTELVVREEVFDLDKLFGWRYTEAINPVHPFKLPKRVPDNADIELLRRWASFRASVGAIGASIWASGGSSVEFAICASVWASVGASVWDSVWASFRAYIGYLFSPCVTKWLNIEHEPGTYPFMSAVELWRRGLVPTYDGSIWRLHSGAKAEIVWEGDL